MIRRRERRLRKKINFLMKNLILRKLMKDVDHIHYQEEQIVRINILNLLFCLFVIVANQRTNILK